MATERNIAVFLDFDNIKLGLEKQNIQFDIEPVFDYLSTKGKIILSKAYGDWDKMSNISYEELQDKKNIKKNHMRDLKKIKDPEEKEKRKNQIKTKFKNVVDSIRIKKSNTIRKIKRQLIEYSFDIVDMPSRRSGKNFSDIQLAVDCLETSIFNKSIDTIAIISGDSDMTPLIKKIRYYGLEVIIIGAEESTSRMLSSVTDVFRFFSFLNLKKIEPSVMRESPYLILCKALTLSRLISGSDVLEKGLVNEKFRLLSPKSYGRYYPFEGLLEDLVKQQIIKISLLKGDKLKVYEDSSLELPAIKHLKFNVYYKNIKELKEYIKPYQELLTEFDNNKEKLKNYINSLIIDLINYSLLPEDYESVIMEGFLKLNESDSNYDDALELVNDILNHMIMSKKITFEEHEKIYIPYYPEYNQNNTIYLLNREIDKLNKTVKETEKEKNILKSKIEDIEDDKELYRKLIHSINIIQMKDRDLHPAIEELTYLSQIHKYRKAASLYLGKAYMKIGEYEKAIEVYNKMVNHGVKNTYVYNVLGTANVKIGNYTSAMENFQNSLMLIPDQPRILHYVNELSRYFSDNNMVSTN